MPANYVPHTYSSTPSPPEISSPLELRSPDLCELFDVWAKVRGEEDIPANPQALLKGVRKLMPYLLLFDPTGDENDFVLRLMGQGVFPDLGRNPSGQRISEHYDPGISLRFLRLLRETYTRRIPIRGLAYRVTPMEQHNYLVETLWLPFGSKERVTKILAMASFDPLPCLSVEKPLRPQLWIRAST
jgi:hypothetical protein